jgi:autotransporter-associated beta strand protein
LTKAGAGTLIFSGNTANSYGPTFVNVGTLVLNKTIANASIPNDLTIGDGVGGINADTVRLALDNQIADGAAIHILSSGRLDSVDQRGPELRSGRCGGDDEASGRLVRATMTSTAARLATVWPRTPHAARCRIASIDTQAAITILSFKI